MSATNHSNNISEPQRLNDYERVMFWKWFISNNPYVTRAQDICDQYYQLTGIEVSPSAVNDINRKLRFVEWYLREYGAGLVTMK